jgi:hypothetical protein
MLALCEFLHRPPSELNTTPEDEAFLVHALNIRNQRQEEAQRQAQQQQGRGGPAGFAGRGDMD